MSDTSNKAIGLNGIDNKLDQNPIYDNGSSGMYIIHFQNILSSI